MDDDDLKCCGMCGCELDYERAQMADRAGEQTNCDACVEQLYGDCELDEGE